MFATATRVYTVTRGRARAMASGATALVLRTTRALGRELADGLLERRPDLAPGAPAVAPDGRAVAGTDEGPLGEAAHRLGRAAATGVSEGMAPGPLWKMAIPFAAGVLATFLFTRSLRRHGPARAG